METTTNHKTELLKSMPTFQVSLDECSGNNECQVKDFFSFEEAKAHYDLLKKDLIHLTNQLDKSHWRDNGRGYLLNLRHLKEIPDFYKATLIDALEEGRQELDRVWQEMMFAYSTCVAFSETYHVGAKLIQETRENDNMPPEYLSKVKMIAIADIKI